MRNQVKVNAKQARELRDRPDILNAARSQPRLDLPEPLGRDDEGAVLHGANGVTVASWFFALRDLEESEKAIIAHIEEVMTHLLIGWVATIAGPRAKTGRHLHRMDERHTEHSHVEVDRRLHVVGAECEVVDAPHCR